MRKSKLEQTVLELRKESLRRGYKISYNSFGRSMWPLISHGDELNVSSVGPEEIHLGDILVFKPKAANYCSPLVHRVIWKEKGENGYRFLTKGDFNRRRDPYLIQYDEIEGKVQCI